MQYLKIPYLEFYITNVCNLSCPGCNRFNNYNFRGIQRWKDYGKVYQRWAQEIKPDSIGILGGEPLLHPDALDWIKGIHGLWPHTFCKVVTNGFYVNKVKGLYAFLHEHQNVQLWIGIHNKVHKHRIMSELSKFLVEPIRFEFDNTNPYQQFMMIIDANQVNIKVEYNWWFHQGALIPFENGFKLHESDAVKAHNNCNMKTCHHFIRGKLYKCGVVALLPEFSQQHNLLLSESDQDLMENYQPLQIDDDIDTKKRFVAKLSDPIPQCKFCPEVYHGDQIFAIEKRDVKA
jgi:hypothetical protein